MTKIMSYPGKDAITCFIIDHSMKVVEGRHRGLFPISIDPVEFILLVNMNNKIERTDLTGSSL